MRDECGTRGRGKDQGTERIAANRLLAVHRQPTTDNRKPMARWPDTARSNVIAILLIFVGVPVLCWLSWWFVRG